MDPKPNNQKNKELSARSTSKTPKKTPLQKSLRIKPKSKMIEKDNPRRGRPKVLEKEEEQTSTPTSVIQQQFYTYLNSIKLRHGLVLTEIQKEKVFCSQDVYPKQTYDFENEMKKVELSLGKYEHFDRKFLLVDLKQLCQLFVLAASMVNSQFSYELYDLLWLVTLTLNENRIEKTISEFYKELKILNRKDFKRYITYFVEKISEQQIRQHFDEFFNKLRVIIRSIVDKPQELHKFITKQLEESLKLLEIAQMPIER